MKSKGRVGTATFILRFKKSKKQRPLSEKEKRQRAKYSPVFFRP